VVLIAGQDLAVATVEPLADEEILFGCCRSGGALCGFEEALANVGTALCGGGAFVAGSGGVDGMQADGSRVDVHGALPADKRAIRMPRFMRRDEKTLINGSVEGSAFPEEASRGRLRSNRTVH
jgi:hypothetical protein